MYAIFGDDKVIKVVEVMIDKRPVGILTCMDYGVILNFCYFDFVFVFCFSLRHPVRQVYLMTS